MHSFGRLPKFYNAELRLKLKDLFGKTGNDIADVVEPILGEQKAKYDELDALLRKSAQEIQRLKDRDSSYVAYRDYKPNPYAFNPGQYDYLTVAKSAWISLHEQRTRQSEVIANLEQRVEDQKTGCDYWYGMWESAEERERNLKERNAEQAKTILTRGVELSNLGMETKSLRDELDFMRKTKLAYRTVYSGYPYN